MTTMPAGRQGRADLHVHTTWSDGAQRPEAVVAASSGRVDVLAITDHDEIRGALVAREYARRQSYRSLIKFLRLSTQRRAL